MDKYIKTATPICDSNGVLSGLYFFNKQTLYKVCGTRSPQQYCRVLDVHDLIKNVETGAMRWLVRHEWTHEAYLADQLIENKTNAKLSKSKSRKR